MREMVLPLPAPAGSAELRLGFDVTPLLGERSGVGNYTCRLLAALLHGFPQHRWLMLGNKPFAGEMPAWPGAEPAFDRWPWSRWLWMQARLPRTIEQSGVDLCHFPNASAPLRLNRPYVVTIHDASLFLLRAYHPPSRWLAIRLLLPLVARRASAVITVSHQAKEDLARVLRLPSSHFQVIYEAAPAHYRPVTDEERRRAVAQKYGLPAEFILYVGTLEPRKNLARLVRAVALLHRKGQKAHLVLAGPSGWKMEQFWREVAQSGLGRAVQLLGYVPEGELPALYSLATVFAFPSLYEGFGLPPVEAMACGLPVLTSAGSAMAEICAGAAHLVDPTDDEAVADGLQRLLSDPAYCAELRQRGLQRAASFSWEQAATETMAVYQQALAAPPNR